MGTRPKSFPTRAASSCEGAACSCLAFCWLSPAAGRAPCAGAAATAAAAAAFVVTPQAVCLCPRRYDQKGAGNASTPEQLDALMHEIGSDRARYEAMVAWKSRKVCFCGAVLQHQPSMEACTCADAAVVVRCRRPRVCSLTSSLPVSSATCGACATQRASASSASSWHDTEPSRSSVTRPACSTRSGECLELRADLTMSC